MSAHSSDSRRLKVLLSAFALGPGRGSEPGVGWNAAVALAEHHDVWVITQDEAREAVEERFRRDPIPGLKIRFFDLDSPLYKHKMDERVVQVYYPQWQRAILPGARKLHAEIGFDVVHHLTFGKYWQPSHLGALGVPFVFGPVGGGESAPRSFWASYGWYGRIYEAARDIGRWTGELNPAVRRTIRQADACLAATDETAARLDALGAQRVVRIPGQTGLGSADLALLDALPTTEPEAPRFVTMARLLHWKGIHLAIGALAVAGLPGATLQVIGDGQDRARLEAEAERLGMADRVVFSGALPRTETLAALAASTALVHPALHDFSPTVIFEAMGLGKPVLALDLNGPATQVNAETGITVPAPNPDTAIRGLADGMRRLAADGALRARMGAVARQRVREHYTWEHKAEIFDRVYREVIEKRTSAAEEAVV